MAATGSARRPATDLAVVPLVGTLFFFFHPIFSLAGEMGQSINRKERKKEAAALAGGQGAGNPKTCAPNRPSKKECMPMTHLRHGRQRGPAYPIAPLFTFFSYQKNTHILRNHSGHTPFTF